jgi:hypothetical protein
MRRSYSRRMGCSHDGCPEFGLYQFERRSDYDDHVRQQSAWTCTRHTIAERVLSVDRMRVEWVSDASKQESYGRFFGSQGLIAHYPAFYAKADDFPAGTRIRITTEAILP